MIHPLCLASPSGSLSLLDYPGDVMHDSWLNSRLEENKTDKRYAHNERSWFVASHKEVVYMAYGGR